MDAALAEINAPTVKETSTKKKEKKIAVAKTDEKHPEQESAAVEPSGEIEKISKTDGEIT